MVDNELDQIATGILYIIDTKFSISNDSEGFLVKAFVTAKIDIDELERLLEQEIEDSIIFTKDNDVFSFSDRIIKYKSRNDFKRNV